jgi:hypothetical protein
MAPAGGQHNEEFMDRNFAAGSTQRHAGGSLEPPDRGQHRRLDGYASQQQQPVQYQ